MCSYPSSLKRSPECPLKVRSSGVWGFLSEEYSRWVCWWKRSKKKKLNTWRSRDQISSKVHIYWSDERSGSQSLMFGGGRSGVGLFGRKVRVAVGHRHHHGDQALRGRCVDGVACLGDGVEALLHAAGRQSRLCVVVPALLDGLAQLAQTLTEPQRKRSKLGPGHLKDSKIRKMSQARPACIGLHNNLFDHKHILIHIW